MFCLEISGSQKHENCCNFIIIFLSKKKTYSPSYLVIVFTTPSQVSELQLFNFSCLRCSGARTQSNSSVNSLGNNSATNNKSSSLKQVPLVVFSVSNNCFLCFESVGLQTRVLITIVWATKRKEGGCILKRKVCEVWTSNCLFVRHLGFVRETSVNTSLVNRNSVFYYMFCCSPSVVILYCYGSLIYHWKIHYRFIS